MENSVETNLQKTSMVVGAVPQSHTLKGQKIFIVRGENFEVFNYRSRN